MTILKGPNAAALYGSAANNGVIVITTKSGASGSVKVNVSSTTSIETIAMYPRTRQIYGISGGDQWSAWGPRDRYTFGRRGGFCPVSDEFCTQCRKRLFQQRRDYDQRRYVEWRYGKLPNLFFL